MLLINHEYQNRDTLVIFLNKNSIKNSNSLLIQIFSSNISYDDFYAIKKELKEILPNTAIIATSTAGIISNGDISDNKIIISFSIFEHSTVKSYACSTKDENEIVKNISDHLITDRTKLLLCFADIMKINSEKLLKEITKKHPSLVIAGGNAGDDERYDSCYVYSNLHNDCTVVFAAIDSDVLHVETKSLLNWKTIGKELCATKADGQRLYEIDNKKALDIYEYYLGKEIRDNMLTKATEFPLIFNDRGVSVARAPIETHEDGSLTLAGELKQGEKIKFGFADISYIEEYNNSRILPEKRNKAEAVYIYTCTARRSVLGNFLNQEISVINKIAPISGFVTYGEFFHDIKTHSTNLLNITTTYVVLSENQNNPELIKIDTKKYNSKDSKDITLRALTTLASRTSEELDESIYYLEQFKTSINEVAIFTTTDETGKITYANKNFEKISGYSQDEIIGKTHIIIRHEDMPKSVFKEIWETIEKGKIWKGHIKNRDKHGKSYHVLSEIGPIYNKDGSFREYIGVRTDVTELEEYKLLLKNELATTSNSLKEKTNYIKQYEEAINTSTMILKTDMNNVITFANNKLCELSEYGLSELIGKNCKKLRHITHQITNKCENIYTQIREGKTVQEILINVSKDGKEYTVDNIFYPIRDLNGNIVECLQIMFDLREVIELNEEITNTQKEVIFTMGAIVETRSKETGLHVKRVAEYSYLLAKLYGLDEDKANLLKQASPMHDIGKVGIPDHILNKPGKLTFEEFEIMKTHAEIGYEMLNHSQKPILNTSSIVARTHHEKWDGSGYPLGLSGEDIHIFGRITAVADVFDALGHDRVYKKAWNLESILKLFKEQKGVHFDPTLIDLFFEHLDEFLKIKDTMQDKI